MSIQQVPERSHKKSYHKWHDLEAARYFSGANEVSGHQKMSRSGGRISLDIPMMSSTRSSAFQSQTHQHNHAMTEKATTTTKEKKHKQPHSPGGRLASFLNSIFSQTSSKKKKSKSCSAQSIKDEDHDSPDVRRKRRSSISHFRSTTNISSSAENSSSEFATPRCTANTPAKNSFKEFKNFLDHHKPAVLLNVSKNNCPIKSSASQKGLHHNYSTTEISKNRDNTRLDDDTFKFCTTTTTTKDNQFPFEKCKIFGNGYLDHDINQSSERNFRNFVDEIDDGADSDSSSDLFELQNFELGGCYSSGLPVYETTHMESIKRGAPITSGAL
ncbi:protein BIG GRAIN 1-like E [Apium graveolens]|uniref:protein BIG GRAIN 1-like E n=1 Tax=Apium graveolens TaxID=4045 RepID=UPI003D79EEA2